MDAPVMDAPVMDAPVMWRVGLLAVLIAAGGCNDTKPTGGPKATTARPTAAVETSGPDTPAADGEATPASDRAVTPTSGTLAPLLAWLDPDAVAAAVVALPPSVDAAALVAVFGIPPRGAKLLDTAAEIDRWLGGFVSEDHPPATWLGEPALVMISTFATGPTVVRPITQSRDEVAAILGAGGFAPQTIEGYQVFYPKKSFPFRVALLDEHTVAFIPAREPGSGLSPLTAGRDLPASDLQTQIEKAYQDTPGLYVELFAAGPMLHFDLDAQLVGARFELLPWQDGGLEGRILLQPERDAMGAVQALEARVPAGETDRIVGLAKDVAYQLDGDFVTGVLQLPAPDTKALGGAP